MSYLLHGSTTHTAMGWLDPIPRAGSLYIGGLYALYQTPFIKAAGITHVLSVIDYETNLDNIQPLKELNLNILHVKVEDDPNVDLLRWFERTGAFIREGLEGGGGVFVHCAMGKSRSAAVVAAYLIERYEIAWEDALKQVEEGRPVCDPNPGFKEQLVVWERMVREEDGGKKRGIYEEWEKSRFKGDAWEWEKRVERERLKGKL